MNILKSEYLVIGSGLSGLFSALKLSRYGRVNLITKRGLKDSNSFFAQGGIAAVMDEEDDFINHIQDTIKAGDYLSKPEIVEYTVYSSQQAIRELINYGVKFDKKGNKYHLGLEGGHSRRRIFHKSDYTGRAIIETLIERVKEEKNIRVFENHQAVDLILLFHPKHTKPENNTCLGAYVYDLANNDIVSFISSKTILATGGSGKAYLYTSNPDIATGDGIAMAYKSGLNLVDMEFVQFHPTCLYHHDARNFLISEALRGEGAILKLSNGRRFMHKYSREKELAPRDIVARAIDKELKESGEDFVLLDISKRKSSFIKKDFHIFIKPVLHMVLI